MILRKLRLPSTLIEEISLELILGITSLKRSPILTRTSDIFLVAKFLRHDVKGLPKETIYHLSILFRDIIGTILINWTGSKLAGVLILTWERGTWRVIVSKTVLFIGWIKELKKNCTISIINIIMVKTENWPFINMLHSPIHFEIG